MSDSSPKRPVPAPSPAEFNWPPTDDELADCFYSGPPVEQVAASGVETLQEIASDGSEETSLKGRESHATNTSCASGAVGFDRPSAGSGASEVEDSAASDIAVFAHENQWSAEIAHLQALIEALTEKVEWRIPKDTRR